MQLYIIYVYIRKLCIKNKVFGEQTLEAERQTIILYLYNYLFNTIMKQLTIYRILSFILVPIALIIGFIDLFVLIMGLSGNPAMLFIAFVMACLVIYVFASLRFLLQGIGNERPCSSNLKDWIKVNAYGTLFIAGMFFLNSTGVFFLGDIQLQQMLGDVMEQQPELAGKVSIETMVDMFRAVAVIMFIISITAIIHVQISFRLLRKYAFLFVK